MLMIRNCILFLGCFLMAARLCRKLVCTSALFNKWFVLTENIYLPLCVISYIRCVKWFTIYGYVILYLLSREVCYEGLVFFELPVWTSMSNLFSVWDDTGGTLLCTLHFVAPPETLPAFTTSLLLVRNLSWCLCRSTVFVGFLSIYFDAILFC